MELSGGDLSVWGEGAQPELRVDVRFIIIPRENWFPGRVPHATLRLHVDPNAINAHFDELNG